MNVDGNPQTSPGHGAGGLYATVWRWHFYAGLYVIPFILILTLTGMAMLFSTEIETLLYPDNLYVAPSGTSLPVSAQLDAVRRQHPGMAIQSYQAPAAPDRSSEVTAITSSGTSSTIFVDPHSAQVLGNVASDRRPARFAEVVHGTLLIGALGDRLVEIAAGFGVVLVISGIYLSWPRKGSLRLIAFRSAGNTRGFWRSLHASTGLIFGAGLLFYLVSGLAWSGVWGEKLVQAWNTFPSPRVASPHNHASLNSAEGHRWVPWNLEQTLLPLSKVQGSAMAPEGPVAIDRVIRAAQTLGIGPHFVVTLPDGPEGVWIVAATSRNGGTLDPRRELTVYVDQYTGEIIQTIGWTDYGLGARAMAAGIPLHRGMLGSWNKALSVLFCAAFLLIAFSGLRMWWFRRPALASHLGAPHRTGTRVPAVVLLAMAALGVAFPLTGAVIVAALFLDFFLIQRFPRLRRALG